MVQDILSILIDCIAAFLVCVLPFLCVLTFILIAYLFCEYQTHELHYKSTGVSLNSVEIRQCLNYD